ncbi:Mlr7403 protein [hydrothermal vent metagenome]|uniref:Mlr7403 protein n=1 Tax=hydrothermal vent metagenome TaxID=652676 RepID=A0A3B0R0M4_9ZZZZ
MSDESLFREIDEDVRRDKIQNIWKKYGSWILALSLGMVLAVGALKGWQYWQKQQAESGGASYFAAVKLAEEGKTTEAEKAFAALKANHAGFAIFGKFKQAAAMAKAGRTSGAISAYDEIASDSDVQPELKNLARIKAAYLLADTASVKELQERVAGFDNNNSPWRSSARELIAFSAYRAGDYALADRKLTQILADLQSTAGAKQRARIFLSVLTPKLPLPNSGVPNSEKTKSN